MTIGREYVNVNLCFENLIYKAMFLRDGSTPLTTAIALQRFWMSSTCHGMFHQFIEQLDGFLKCSRLTVAQLCQILLSLFRINKGVHAQRELSHLFISWGFEKLMLLPCLICSLASSTRAKNSSSLRRVGSAFFSAMSLRRYLAARFRRFSSSAIMLILRRISAFICMAVIT